MAVTSYGCTFTIGGVSCQITNFNVGGIQISAIETTHLASSNAFKEFLPGLGDGGELSFTINYIKAQMTSLYALARTVSAFTLTLSDGSTLTGSGFFTSLGLAAPEDDRITQDVTVKITGKPTFTAS